MNLIDMDRLRKELMAKGDIPIHEVFNTIWDQPIVNICEDAISREAAIDAFEKFIHELGIEDEPYNYGEMALSVQNVPSVTPIDKKEKEE